MPTTSTQKIVKSFCILDLASPIAVTAGAYGPTGGDLGHFLIQAAPDGHVVGCTINSVSVQWSKTGATPPSTCKLRIAAAPDGTIAFTTGAAASFDTGSSANQGYATWNLNQTVSIDTWLSPYTSLLSTELGRLYCSFKFDQDASISVFLATVTYEMLD